MTDLDRHMLAGNVDMLVLAVLARGSLHGYGIRWAVIHRSRGSITPVCSAIYRVLRILQRNGCVKAIPGSGRRRCFGLTAKGRTMLALRHRKWESFAAGISSVLSRK